MVRTLFFFAIGDIVLKPVEEDYFKNDHTFGSEQGFHVAFAITRYGNEDNQLDESFGRPFARQQIWGERDPATGSVLPTYWKYIETYPCSSSDFYSEEGNNTQTKFYAPNASQKKDYERFKQQFICLKDEVELFGHWNSDHGKIFQIGFERCNQAKNSNCKTNEQIDEWLKNRYIVIYYNIQMFKIDQVQQTTKDKSDEDNFIKEGRIAYYQMSPQLRQSYFNVIKMTELHLRDRILTVGFDDQEEQQIFNVKQGETRLNDRPDDIQCLVSFELNLDLQYIKRKVYSIMDWLGDIGGLSGSLYTLFYSAILIFQFNNSYSELAQHTYRIRKDEDKSDAQVPVEPEESINKNQTPFKQIPIGIFGSMKLSLQRLLPFCLKKSCLMSRRDRLSHKAHKLLMSELNVVKLIHFMRFSQQAFCHLLSEKLYRTIECDTKFKVLAFVPSPVATKQEINVISNLFNHSQSQEQQQITSNMTNMTMLSAAQQQSSALASVQLSQSNDQMIDKQMHCIFQTIKLFSITVKILIIEARQLLGETQKYQHLVAFRSNNDNVEDNLRDRQKRCHQFQQLMDQRHKIQQLQGIFKQNLNSDQEEHHAIEFKRVLGVTENVKSSFVKK